MTGVSRRAGIAWAVAQRLQRDGYALSLSGWPEHDEEQPWGGDPAGTPELDGALWEAADLAAPEAPARLVGEHVARHGGLDALVAVHARSSDQSLETATAAELDLSFAVNARATVLLVQAAARAGVRRVVYFTTGVHHDPMPPELPYALSKVALQGITTTLAASLAPAGATVTCINPGPVDTGYADEDHGAFIAQRMPLAPRWGRPQDIVGLVSWLLTDEAGWCTGQTIDIDGGWALRGGVRPRGA